MTKRSTLFVGILLLLAFPTVSSSQAAGTAERRLFFGRRPGLRNLACFGSTFYETPHVDRLAATGMKFTQAYAACPVCSPTRASILTGKYPQRSGITDYIAVNRSNQPEKWSRRTRLLPAPYADRLALNEITLAEALKQAGYATFFAGKWHLGPKGYYPEDQGFDVNKGGLGMSAPGAGETLFFSLRQSKTPRRSARADISPPASPRKRPPLSRPTATGLFWPTSAFIRSTFR